MTSLDDIRALIVVWWEADIQQNLDGEQRTICWPIKK